MAGDEVLTMVTQTLVAAMADLEKRLRAQARDITEVRRLMTVSVIRPIAALGYHAAIADPNPLRLFPRYRRLSPGTDAQTIPVGRG
jgi:hypothetical protein